MQEKFYQVERLLDIQISQKQIMVFAKWQDYDNDENSWEPLCNLHPKTAVKSLKELQSKFAHSKSKQILIQKSIEYWEKKLRQKPAKQFSLVEAKLERPMQKPANKIVIEEDNIYVCQTEINLESN